MSRSLRCLLLLAVLLAGGAPVAAEAGAGPGESRGGAGVYLAADPLDTSWGDDYIRPPL
ncbi:hypothetical protein [Streptomyces nojiriensis]|uniref:hypothetical protein n=1 Tax=Streptomyces nojiriensis TaxID=66374 RepID=UPI00365F62E2